MLNNARIVCFSATRNADAARRFYADVLGLSLTEDGPSALAFDANGVMLRIQKIADHVPLSKGTVLGWHVESIQNEIHDLLGKGVQFERYATLTQDGLGIWTSPSGAQVAWFRDPDGNVLSLTQW